MANDTIDLLRRAAPVMPVLVIDDVDSAVPLARALVAGGLRVLEVTLRTPCALDAIRAIADEVPDAIVGAGTLVAADQAAAVARAGGRFAVSPGLSELLIDAAAAADLDYLPGVMTPSDIQRALAAGLSALKFFPASQAGGRAMLKAFGGPFPDVTFCPTGGITADTMREYLALPNVACVGGSWVAPKNAVTGGDWERIKRLAAATADG